MRSPEGNERLWLAGVDYCAFLTLDEARRAARNKLHEAGMRTQVVIKDSGLLGPDAAV